jgi:hypothetical protein
MDGVALLESLGDLYEYVGTDENGRHLFQSVNDDYCIKASLESLLSTPGYEVKY